MADPLSGIVLKVTRGHDQLNALKAEVDAFFHGKAYKLTPKFEPEELAAYMVVEGKEIPPMWSVIIGEIIHDLRSALDHLVWELVIKDTGAQPNGTKTQFPIFETKAGYESERGEKLCLRGVGTTARALIQSAQPFATGEGDKSPLWQLRELSNWDKHKSIALAALLLGKAEIEANARPEELEFLAVTRSGLIENGAIVCGVRLRPSDVFFGDRINQMNMKGKAAFNVAFQDPALIRELRVLPTLAAIHNRVASTVEDIANTAF
jgi:hypothetical protein